MDVSINQYAAAGLGNTPIVSVVDGDASVREALKSLIHSVGWVARTFASAWEFLSRPRVLTPGCLILDVTLPDLSGLELQRRIADRAEMPIIFITRQSDVLTTVQAMKAGALEFMTKPLREDLMMSAIGSAIEHSRIALSQAAELQALRERHASLSCRERQVMALVVQGVLNKRIGAELGISEITVKAHRGKVMRKMRAQSLPELVTLAARLEGGALGVASRSIVLLQDRYFLMIDATAHRVGGCSRWPQSAKPKSSASPDAKSRSRTRRRSCSRDRSTPSWTSRTTTSL
jgi:FixJ family two-component response regulator